MQINYYFLWFDLTKVKMPKIKEKWQILAMMYRKLNSISVLEEMKTSSIIFKLRMEVC